MVEYSLWFFGVFGSLVHTTQRLNHRTTDATDATQPLCFTVFHGVFHEIITNEDYPLLLLSLPPHPSSASVPPPSQVAEPPKDGKPSGGLPPPVEAELHVQSDMFKHTELLGLTGEDRYRGTAEGMFNRLFGCIFRTPRVSIRCTQPIHTPKQPSLYIGF